MTFLSQIYAEFVKKLTLWFRQPIWAVIGIVGPLAISTLMIASFATMAELPVWKIGLIDEDDSMQSRALAQTITAKEGTIPYYTVITTNKEEANRLYRKGELYMVVTIPRGFGNELEAGNAVTVNADIINAHADQTKNLRLGLDARLYLFYDQYMLPESGKPGVIYSYSTNYPVEIPRARYMSSGALMLTILLAAMIYAALFAALEYEDKTVLEINLPPHGSLSSMIGTLLATVVEVLLVLTIVAVVNFPLWNLQIPALSDIPGVIIAVILLIIIFAIIGYGLGNKARDIRLVIAPTMLIVLTLWILSGGISPMETVAGSEIIRLLPTAATLNILAKEFAGLQNISTSFNLLIITIWTIIIILLAAVLRFASNRRSFSKDR